jgi:hypothetical protein
MVSHALLTSTSVSKFSKATNLFEILTQYCSLHSTSFNSWDWTSNMNPACSLFTYCHSFPNFCHHEVVVSITICCPEWTDKCRFLSMKIWSILLWVLQSGDVQVTLWMLRCGNIVILPVRFLDEVKLDTLTPLLLLLFACWLSFTIVGLKMSSLPSLELKSPNKFSYGISGIYQKPVLILYRTCPLYQQIYLIIIRIITYPLTRILIKKDNVFYVPSKRANNY